MHLCGGPPEHSRNVVVIHLDLSEPEQLLPANVHSLHANLEETHCHFPQIPLCKKIEMPICAVTKSNLLQETCYSPLLLLRPAMAMIALEGCLHNIHGLHTWTRHDAMTTATVQWSAYAICQYTVLCCVVLGWAVLCCAVLLCCAVHVLCH